MTKGERFEYFVKTRFELRDWSNYLSVDQTRLSRRKILEACQFARSSLYQSPVIKIRLSEVEAELRRIGVLRHLTSVPDTLLDETSFLTVVTEMEKRLDILGGRMSALISSIQDVRGQVQIFNIE